MSLMESSFDLMTNPKFNIAKRASWMMPMPFVLNDAVVIQQKIKPTPKIEIPIPVNTEYQSSNPINNDTIPAVNETN